MFLAGVDGDDDESKGDAEYDDEDDAAAFAVDAPFEGRISTALKMLPLEVTRDSRMMKTPRPWEFRCD